jgi:hypothetical protein
MNGKIARLIRRYVYAMYVRSNITISKREVFRLWRNASHPQRKKLRKQYEHAIARVV